MNFVSGIYDDKISDRRNKLVQLTADEKEQIDQLRTKLLKDIETVEENKKIIQNLMSNPQTAMIAHKAGLSLTDSPDVVAQKLNKYYVANPTLIPESIASLQEKYPDAGINYWDSPDTINAKLQKSTIFKNSVASNGSGLTANQLITQAQKMIDNGQADSLEEAISMLQSGFGGFGGFGGDTSQLSSLIGEIGGQCGDFVHKIVDNVPAMGNTYEEKMRLANVSTNQWQVGDMLIQKTKMPYGHVSIVTAVNGDGTVTVTESNWNGDERVGQRTIKIGDKSVTGVYRGGTLKAANNTTDEVAAIKNSLMALLPRLTAEQKKSANALVNQALKAGDIERAKEAIATTAISALPAEQQNKAFGRLVAIDALRDIQASLVAYKARGGNTGIFTGTAEQISQKIGQTSDPVLAQIGNKIALSMIAYRNSVSGAAFTESEAQAYERLFPNILKGDELNNARITSLINVFDLNQKSTLATVLGKTNYDSIFGQGGIGVPDNVANSILLGLTGGSVSQGQSSAYQVYNKLRNPYQF